MYGIRYKSIAVGHTCSGLDPELTRLCAAALWATANLKPCPIAGLRLGGRNDDWNGFAITLLGFLHQNDFVDTLGVFNY